MIEPTRLNGTYQNTSSLKRYLHGWQEILPALSRDFINHIIRLISFIRNVLYWIGKSSLTIK